VRTRDPGPIAAIDDASRVASAPLAHEWFQRCEYVNPDLIAQDELGDWNDPQAVLRAVQIAAERREVCLRIAGHDRLRMPVQ
jgi:hypothetical protein